jgi:hypothetical protein
MTGYVRYRLAPRRLHSAILAMAVTSWWVIPASGQNPAVSVGADEASALAGVFPMIPRAVRFRV